MTRKFHYSPSNKTFKMIVYEFTDKDEIKSNMFISCFCCLGNYKNIDCYTITSWTRPGQCCLYVFFWKRCETNTFLSKKASFFNVKMSKAFIQKPAPDFEATAVTEKGEFKTVKLSDYKGKYLVFFFYPLDFTFVCPTEIIAYSDRVEEFQAIGCEVLACSIDSQFSHLAWTEQPRNKGGLGKMKIPILSDLTKQVSRDYGVLLEDQGISLRGLFIIDDKGTLRQITVNDLPVGRSVDETLRLVQALKYTDKHGEVCPAGWKPGADTIKTDNAEEYFKKQ